MKGHEAGTSPFVCTAYMSNVCFRDSRQAGAHEEDLGITNGRNHLGRLGNSFSNAFLMVHVRFAAGTVCKSSAHYVTLEVGVMLSLLHDARN